MATVAADELVAPAVAGGLLEKLQQAADGGDAWAQLNLGAAYDNGLLGLPVNLARAAAWYEKAAQQGVADAQFNLAHLMVTRPQSGHDDEQARYWLQQAAVQGMPSAQYLFAVMLLQGMGGEVNGADGVSWMLKAAAAGYVPAQEYLATQGVRVP